MQLPIALNGVRGISQHLAVQGNGRKQRTEIRLSFRGSLSSLILISNLS